MLQRIHVDFMGPFQGKMFLVVMDAYSKWPEVFMMQTTTTSKTIECLRYMFGYPEQLVSDNGPQFTSEEFCCLHGILWGEAYSKCSIPPCNERVGRAF